MRQEVNHCKETGKFCYTSEAKAVRAMNRYEDIKRVYRCDSCDSWHTTKMGEGLAKIHNLPLRKVDSTIDISDVEKRLKMLRDKLENNENENGL